MKHNQAFWCGLVAAIGLVLGLATAVAAQPASEQIIFANSDNPNPGSNQTGIFTYTTATAKNPFFGFWIWCEGDSTNLNYGVCQGNMYFYGVSEKGVAVTGSVTELSGIYQMSVHSTRSTDGKAAVDCHLTNQSSTITPGLTNFVNVDCTAPSGTGTSPYTVIQVTGP